MKSYHEQDWNFVNMNSPADLFATYESDCVFLNEYNGCRNGHALVSKFYVNGDDTSFQTQVSSIGEGVGIGLYFGDGCYDNYLLIAVNKEGISVRIPNGVPLGDTFRTKGPKRYYEIINKKISIEDSFIIGFEKKENRLVVFLNGKTELKIENLILSFQTEGKKAKVLVKALNESNTKPKAEIILNCFLADGVANCFDLIGTCIDSITKCKLKNVYVHVMGEFEKWAKTDGNGEFILKQIPFGKHQFVCGLEGEGFCIIDSIHDGTVKKLELHFSKIDIQRESRPQENLKTNLKYTELNGIWRFDFDKNGIGEKEEWFNIEKHEFSKCIQVPFSWQSLKAFGEEELVNEYSLHQANSYTCNSKEVGEIGWYQKTIRVNKQESKREMELVFAAISGTAKIWLDNKLIGCTTDSYNKYCFPLGKLENSKDYVLTVKVEYVHGNNWACSGKQGFWFTDSPGIWQNVWIQEEKKLKITDILIYYNIVNDMETELEFQMEFSATDNKRLKTEVKNNSLRVFLEKPGYCKIIVDYLAEEEVNCQTIINESITGMNLSFDAVHEDYFDKKEFYCYLNKGENKVDFLTKKTELEIIDAYTEKIDIEREVSLLIGEKIVATTFPKINQKTGKLECSVRHTITDTLFWTTNEPYQYQIKAIINDDNESIEFTRKLGIREVNVLVDENSDSRHLTINKKKTYIRGVMDQGYNPWGLYTYPRLRGLVAGSAEFDINAARACGYNLIRMHIKDNEPDWYDICDENGVLVWDEIPANFYGVAEDKHWMSMFKREIKQITKKHNYHTAIILCSVFNESWGITGDHEKSPWDNLLGQEIIREHAKYYKKNSKQVLVIDNSGYAKTSETQIIDYHSYPSGYEDARNFFEKLARQNYNGSFFNFFNKENIHLFENLEIVDLLQRNCAQNLNKIEYLGNEKQKQQPVIISEFVHTDKQEELVRIFPEISGYIRMNIISQENEDTSPLTASRKWRDFGIVNEKFEKVTYKVLNSENLIYIDFPFLSKVYEKSIISLPIYISLWKEDMENQSEIDLSWKFIGINKYGYYEKTAIGGCIKEKIEICRPYLFHTLEFEIPKGMLGGYLFAEISYLSQKLATTYIQVEIFSQENDTSSYKLKDNCLEIEPSNILRVDGFFYQNQNGNENRNIVWGYGSGSVEYGVNINSRNFKMACLVLELSDCTYLEGTRETDEETKESQAKLYIQNELVEIIKMKGLSCDKRALFSNSSSSKERISTYSETGTYGYGTRISIEIPSHLIQKIKEDGLFTIRLDVENTGITIYGRRMGRHGCNPLIFLK